MEWQRTFAIDGEGFKIELIMPQLKSLFLAAVILGITFSLSGCKKPTVHDTSTIDGIWYMAKVSGGLSGIDLDYVKGEVIWRFDLSTKTLHVTNNILTSGPKKTYSKFKTGVYYFAIASIDDQPFLVVNAEKIGDYTLTPSKLYIDEGVSTDGLLTEFTR